MAMPREIKPTITVCAPCHESIFQQGKKKFDPCPIHPVSCRSAFIVRPVISVCKKLWIPWHSFFRKSRQKSSHVKVNLFRKLK